MTLREKICKPFGGLLNETADELEKVVDDYVIEVIEWFATDEAVELIKDLILVGELNKNYSAKDLLRIYKKEKGL
jgi:hypothetical protein